VPWERSIGKASACKLKIYAKKDGRYDVSWYPAGNEIRSYKVLTSDTQVTGERHQP